MNTPKKKWLIAVLGGALVIWILFKILRPAATPVEVATIERGQLQVTVEEQGRTRARQRYTVAAPITGRLLRTKLDEGDEVQKGDVLVTIKPPPEDARTKATQLAEVATAEARQREAEALLAEAEMNHQQAYREAARRVELYKRQLISLEEHDLYASAADTSEARLASSQAALAATKAQVRSARARLLGVSTDSGEKNTGIAVTAPVTGCVLRVFEESERVVQAGSALFELCEGHALELVIDLLTEAAVQVEPGDPIIITGWGGTENLDAVVRYVEPGAFTKISTLGVEEQRVNVIADLQNPPPQLGAEFRIEASIITWTGEDILKVPTSAIFRRGNVWQTFVVSSNRARLTQVEIGHRGTDYAEVLAGLEEGMSVIVFPSDLLHDGVPVIITDRSK